VSIAEPPVLGAESSDYRSSTGLIVRGGAGPDLQNPATEGSKCAAAGEPIREPIDPESNDQRRPSEAHNDCCPSVLSSKSIQKIGYNDMCI
jgi:hypothetical protein